MLRVTLRNLFARKVRLLLSAFAIVIGVAFVAGSLVYTDTMSKSFDNIIEGGTADVTVRPKGAGDTNGGSSQLDTRTITAATLAKLGTAPGAARVDGTVQAQTLFVVGRNGKVVGGTGAPTLTFNYNNAPSITGKPSVSISKGSAPHGADEVLLDPGTADKAGYRLGDTVKMVSATSRRPTLRATLVGIAEFGGGSLAGASLVLFDTPTTQQLFLGGRDAYTSISLTAKPGVSQVRLAAQAQRLVPRGVEAVTGTKVAKETQDQVGKIINIFGTLLLVFAAIALVVGTFLIINTFSILVAQRSRELALLRALGASRRQVTRSVLVESFVVGLVGSTLGLLAGFGLAAALKAVFAKFGLDLSGTPLVFAPRTAVAAYVVGLLVTMFAAYLPARRAAKIAPVAAMRDDIALPESSLRRRLVLGALLALVGVGLIVLGLVGTGGQGALKVGLGVFAILIGVALMSPVLGRPVLHGLGAVYERLFGTVGTLATQNTLRNPRRTASTASALMIGLALVTTISVLAASVNTSIDVSVKKEFTSDFLMTNAIGQPFSTSIGDQVRKSPDVGQVAEFQFLPADVCASAASTARCGKFGLTAGDSTDISSIFDITMRSGTINVVDKSVALSQDTADRLKKKVGDTISMRFPTGKQSATVTGIYKTSNVLGGALVPYSTVSSARLPRWDSAIAVNAADSGDKVALGKELKSLVKNVPTVSVQTQTEFSKQTRKSVDQLLLLVYALLGLAIVIAVLGIVNTLALSVIERTREVGLLRAVGLSRRQLRRMVRLESIAIAVLGAVLGVIMGLLFGTVLQRVIQDQGVTNLSIPAVRLMVFIVLAAIVGVLAAVFPARRAAKLNVLRAISTE